MMVSNRNFLFQGSSIVEDTSIHLQLLNFLRQATQSNSNPTMSNPYSVKRLHCANRASDTWQTISIYLHSVKIHMFALKIDVSPI